MKRSFLILLLLAGCSTEPTKDQLAVNARQCSAYGYKPKTDMHANCELYLANASREQNKAKINSALDVVGAVGDGMAAGYSTPAVPPPIQPFNTFQAPQTVIVQPAAPTLSQTVNSMPRYQ